MQSLAPAQGAGCAQVLLTGATSTVGAQLVRALLARQTRIRILAREPEKASAQFPNSDSLAIVEGDFSKPDTWGAALKGVEKVFLLTTSTLGREQVVVEGRFARAAKDAGVRHLVKVSVYAANASDPTSSITRWHADAERAIEETGIGFTFLRPNLYMQNLLRDDLASIRHGVLHRPVNSGMVSLYDARDLAEVAAVVLQSRGVEHIGATYELTGPQSLSNAQVVESLTRHTGKAVNLQELTDGAIVQHWRAQGMPNSVAMTLVQLYQSYRKGRAAAVVDNTEVLTGRPARSLDQFIAEHRERLL